MNTAAVANKPLTPVAWLMTAFKPALSDEPVVLRADAGTAHRFVKKSGGVWVELNPVRERECGLRYAAVAKARDEKINGAGAIRDQKLRDAKARHAAEVAQIETEHRNIAAIAANEFHAAEQALLAEFSTPPAAPPAAAP